MVVVVQLFATDEDAPRHDVGAGIFAGKVAVTPVMADAVDDAGGKEWNPEHLHGPDGQADRAEQQHLQRQQDEDAGVGVRCVERALQPVIRRAVAVPFQCGSVNGFGAIKLGALP